MTNTRTHGFSRSTLSEYLAEFDEDTTVDEPTDTGTRSDDFDDARREIAWLRKEVADMRERLNAHREKTEGTQELTPRTHPAMRVAAIAAAIWIFARLRIDGAWR